MAKPYVIEFTIRTVVMADDEDEAYSEAADCFSEISGDQEPIVDVCGEVKEKKDLPSGWDMQCIPYGGDGFTRLEKLIESKEAP